jgi:drug/metabolite transporter (DMT)-like permease
VVGFLLVLLSSIFFCFQNVIVRVLFSHQTILGVFPTGGFVTPNLQHSFLLLFMRMALVVPCLGVLATRLYPQTWNDLGQFRKPEKWEILGRSLGGGILMFLYLALLYISVGLIPTGVALTLFFTYPVFTALFSWKLFDSRPTAFQWGVMGLVLLGSFLSMPQASAAVDRPVLIGIITGIASGLAYALYTVNAQKAFETFHPVPFTWISFATTLVLSAASLLLWNTHEGQFDWTALWIGGALSAIATSTGHLLNNFGIRQIGATTAAMIGASNPALTVVLAWFTIQETLDGRQLFGVLLVTLSVALLSRDRSLSTKNAR